MTVHIIQMYTKSEYGGGCDKQYSGFLKCWVLLSVDLRILL